MRKKSGAAVVPTTAAPELTWWNRFSIQIANQRLAVGHPRAFILVSRARKTPQALQHFEDGPYLLDRVVLLRVGNFGDLLLRRDRQCRAHTVFDPFAERVKEAGDVE